MKYICATKFWRTLLLASIPTALVGCGTVYPEIQNEGKDSLYLPSSAPVPSPRPDPDHEVIGDWAPGFDPNYPGDRDIPDRPY